MIETTNGSWELNDGELAAAKHVAEIRADSFAHDNYGETAFRESSYAVHLIGAKAEVAVSSYYGIPIDDEQRLAGDEHDFEIEYRGERATLDVKTTTYRPPWLQVRESKTGSDYYLACYLDDLDARTVHFVGFASRETVLDADKIRSPAGGDHYNYRLWSDELDGLPPKEAISDADRTARLRANPAG